ncbi:MAG: aromatic ring-hydroxylating dioxygenase subunit alpha [Novosphingobium sp.]|jgi:phenylpropionate dioxygenase-like ring-hydroxylating dioxygenase large terminal subunit|nr:aromatic ring-hydroxylating dioxygenase subunit alpha [Novosphingobium sp.]
MNVHFGAIETRDDPLVLGTDPIPARYYYDPEWYELERKAIFMRTWLNVGHVCELPETGSFVRREIEFARASLLLVRGKDGTIRAMHNACTHRGTQLTDEECGKRPTFSCPYHMWTFGTDGALLSAPDFERFDTTKEACALRQVAVDVCGGLIFINFDPQQSLREYLGPMAEMLEQLPVARATTFHEYVYELDANWKMDYDNFQENYHLRFIHPRSGGAGVWPGNPFGYPSHFSLNGRHRTQTIWADPDAEIQPTMLDVYKRSARRLAADGILDHPLGREYIALFPNLFLFCSPGSHFLHTVFPLGPEKARGVIRLYWIGEDETASTRYAREFAMAQIRDIHSEDVGVVQAGQRGISSGALEYLHFQEKEILCRHLIKVCEEEVEAYIKANGA